MTSYACIHQISIHTHTCKHAHAHNPIYVKFAVHMSLSWLLIGTQLYTTNEFPGEFTDSYTIDMFHLTNKLHLLYVILTLG